MELELTSLFLALWSPKEMFGFPRVKVKYKVAEKRALLLVMKKHKPTSLPQRAFDWTTGNRVHTQEQLRLAMGNHEHVVKTTENCWCLVSCSSKDHDDPVFSDMLAFVTKKVELAVGKVPRAREGDDADRRQACLSFRLAENSNRPGRPRTIRSQLASTSSCGE